VAVRTVRLRQHFLSLPAEVLEAAEVDGAGHVRRLLSFVVPMSGPAVITVTLLALIDEWNGFIWPLIVTNSDEMRTVPVGLLFLKANEGVDDWGAIMAGTMLVIVPMLVLFLIARRFIVAGLAGTSVSR
jgi:sn-glycerol 3-phosphate transport system permease protein